MPKSKKKLMQESRKRKIDQGLVETIKVWVPERLKPEADKAIRNLGIKLREEE